MFSENLVYIQWDSSIPPPAVQEVLKQHFDLGLDRFGESTQNLVCLCE